MTEARDNSGVVFKNADKTEANPNWPDYQGNAVIGGASFWLSAWIKSGAKGKFMSLAFKPKEAARPSAQPKQASFEHDDSDVPF